jgi:hypothetical protein
MRAATNPPNPAKYDPVPHGEEHKPKALRGMRVSFCDVEQNHRRRSKHGVAEDTATILRKMFTVVYLLHDDSGAWLSANLTYSRAGDGQRIVYHNHRPFSC